MMTERPVQEIAFDFAGLEIGIAEYDYGHTGCTVLHFPNGGAACATDVRGGSPGVIGGYPRTDAVCFAGGSLYGLEAVHGVAGELLRRRGSARWGEIAVVSGAIIYDFGPRETIVYPDKELGRRALLAARTGACPVGRRGAGRLATVGKVRPSPQIQPEPGGQGAAFCAVGDSGVRVLIVTVVNSLGVVVDRSGRIVRGCYDVQDGVRRHPREVLDPMRAEPSPPAIAGATENTTITAVVTNQQMSPTALAQFGRQVHVSMARVIQPFHTPRDGDVLFALSTEAVPKGTIAEPALSEIASDLAWDAILVAVDHP